MVETLPKEMREPRRPKRKHGGTTEGWYYINPDSIDVYATGQGGTAIRLTRKQLERCLEIMDGFQERL